MDLWLDAHLLAVMIATTSDCCLVDLYQLYGHSHPTVVFIVLSVAAAYMAESSWQLASFGCQLAHLAST
jgi:hypothetical protein